MSRPERFLVDGMLGRLARWLRVAGHDAVYEPPFDDLVLAERARRENRILLTRDRHLASRRGIRSLLIEGDDLEGQLRQVLSLFPPPGPGSRCILCNVPLEEAAKSAVQDLVPPYVREHQERFWVCPLCRRIYWQGTHWERMQQRLRDSTNPGHSPASQAD